MNTLVIVAAAENASYGDKVLIGIVVIIILCIIFPKKHDGK